MAVLHLFCALALLNRPPEQAFWGLLIGGALLAAWTIGVLGSALGALRGPRWLWSMVSFPVFWATGLGVLAFGSLQAGAEADRWLYALPPAALLASWGLLYVGARQQPGELALLAATLPEGADLLGDALPLRVRYRVPCQVPYGLRVTSLEEGVPLGNPILDHLLGLSTVSPAESARLLSDSEDTVLGLLHRFPDSHLEADAVVFEATAAQLAEAGDTQRALEEGVGAAQALAELLAQVGNTPDQGIDT
ncbi:MAG: hypothetical protein VX899_16425 [Myxococcota bacterium]|nr:hypothetical protein [Myxococcota bacterium]